MSRTWMPHALPLLAAIAVAPAHADAELSLYDGIESYHAANPVALQHAISGSNAGVVASASGKADLATGTLGAAIAGQAVVCCATSGIAGANAYLSDVITFHGPGTSVPIDLSMHVDGTFSMSGTSGGSIAVAINSQLRLETGLVAFPTASATLHLDRFYQVGLADTIDGSVSGSPGSFLVKSLGGADALLKLTVLMPTERPIQFQAYLSDANTVAAPLLPFDADFAHTAQLALSLPTGYGYTSASGAFLTAAPVPEPHAAWLLLAGLAGIGWQARRRR